tara:strand:- start:69 stop:254 length:186 start_codon:yes stop_codon:yes gene_type:complete
MNKLFFFNRFFHDRIIKKGFMNNKKSSSGLAKRTIKIIGGGGLGVFIFIFLVKFIKQVILN